MQFYIIDPDPGRSAEMLPDYAIQKVNVREGWQILSDIGHIHGVTWPHQTKLYSASHAKTLSLCASKLAFVEFLRNYEYCLLEYRKRFPTNKCPWFGWYHDGFTYPVRRQVLSKLSDNPYYQSINYLLVNKADKLTKREKERLIELCSWKKKP